MIFFILKISGNAVELSLYPIYVQPSVLSAGILPGLKSHCPSCFAARASPRLLIIICIIIKVCGQYFKSECCLLQLFLHPFQYPFKSREIAVHCCKNSVTAACQSVGIFSTKRTTNTRHICKSRWCDHRRDPHSALLLYLSSENSVTWHLKIQSQVSLYSTRFSGGCYLLHRICYSDNRLTTTRG